MSGKISLIVFGLIVIVAVLVSAENSEDSSLSEDLASSRVVREADAGRRKRKQRNNKKSKKGFGNWQIVIANGAKNCNILNRYFFKDKG